MLGDYFVQKRCKTFTGCCSDSVVDSELNGMSHWVFSDRGSKSCRSLARSGTD